MHLEIFLTLSNVQNDRLSAIIHFQRYLVNRTRLLDYYHKTKCDISGEDALIKFLA